MYSPCGHVMFCSGCLTACDSGDSFVNVTRLLRDDELFIFSDSFHTEHAVFLITAILKFVILQYYVL